MYGLLIPQNEMTSTSHFLDNFSCESTLQEVESALETAPTILEARNKVILHRFDFFLLNPIPTVSGRMDTADEGCTTGTQRNC